MCPEPSLTVTGTVTKFTFDVNTGNSSREFPSAAAVVVVWRVIGGIGFGATVGGKDVSPVSGFVGPPFAGRPPEPPEEVPDELADDEPVAEVVAPAVVSG